MDKKGIGKETQSTTDQATTESLIGEAVNNRIIHFSITKVTKLNWNLFYQSVFFFSGVILKPLEMEYDWISCWEANALGWERNELFLNLKIIIFTFVNQKGNMWKIDVFLGEVKSKRKVISIMRYNITIIL